jgi:hypothetical protein
MSSRPVIVAVLVGDNVISRVRELLGPTNSKVAPKGTIRGDYGTEMMRNVCHASDSPAAADAEVRRFFRPDEVFAPEASRALSVSISRIGPAVRGGGAYLFGIFRDASKMCPWNFIVRIAGCLSRRPISHPPKASRSAVSAKRLIRSPPVRRRCRSPNVTSCRRRLLRRAWISSRPWTVSG